MTFVQNDDYFSTPILFIIFNDIKKSRLVFEEIKKIKPKSLYLAADGPRKENAGEAQRCMQTREIINEINWDCEVKTFFKEENSGSAGLGVYSAIEWFFQNVEEGIVLEYDVVPHPDFFPCCQELLMKYRDNESVMVISGSNFQDGILRGNCSYYFSSIPTLWGFATWRRAFKKVEYNVNVIDRKELLNSIPYFKDKALMRYWKYKFDCMKKGLINTWDYQFLFSIWMNKGIAIIANKNLVTHYVVDGDSVAENFNSHIPGITNVPSLSILPLTHQNFILVDELADMYLVRKFKLRLTNFGLIYAYLREFLIPESVVHMLKVIVNLMRGKSKNERM